MREHVMDNFEIVLSNDRRRPYSWGLLFIFAISLVLFLFYSFYSSSGVLKIILILTAITGFFVCFYEWKARKNNRYSFKYSITYFFLVLCWVFINAWFALAHLALAISDSLMRRKLVVHIDESGIEYPSIPVKKIVWEDIEQAILKDGILTIDLKNNHLMQNEIESLNNGNETMLNDFFRKKLDHL